MKHRMVLLDIGQWLPMKLPHRNIIHRSCRRPQVRHWFGLRVHEAEASGAGHFQHLHGAAVRLAAICQQLPQRVSTIIFSNPKLLTTGGN